MLQMGEGSGVAMGAIDLPADTLVAGMQHTLRVANVVAQAGPGGEPDPTTISFTDAPRP